jgi:hypothetical protein
LPARQIPLVNLDEVERIADLLIRHATPLHVAQEQT